jgi:hypothetical protein
MNRLPVLGILLAAACLLSGCGERESVFALTRLTIRTGDVPAGQIDRYADQVLADLFPTGFTRVDSRWQQKNRDGSQVSEPCVVFDIIHLANNDNARRVDGAVLVAKRQFGSDAVLVVEGRPDVRY